MNVVAVILHLVVVDVAAEQKNESEVHGLRM